MHDDAMHSGAGQDRDGIDILLDAALASYANPAPSPAMTNRILASTVRASNRPKLPRWFAWSIPALAALLLLAIFLMHHSASPHQKSLVAANPALSRPPISNAPAAVAPGATPLSPRAPQRPARAIRAMEPAPHSLAILRPRLEVFPTPTPLTPEEQALAEMVNRNPGGVTRQIAQSATTPQSQQIEPIHIAAIQIPPLNPPDHGGN